MMPSTASTAMARWPRVCRSGSLISAGACPARLCSPRRSGEGGHDPPPFRLAAPCPQQRELVNETAGRARAATAASSTARAMPEASMATPACRVDVADTRRRLPHPPPAKHDGGSEYTAGCSTECVDVLCQVAPAHARSRGSQCHLQRDTDDSVHRHARSRPWAS